MLPSREGHTAIFSVCVVTNIVIPRTFLQNFMRKCETVLRKKKNIKKTTKMGKNNPKCPLSLGVGDRCELFYVFDHLSNASKVHM